MKARTLLLIASLLTIMLPGSIRAEEIRVSAAASMTDGVRQLAQQFQGQHKKITISTNFASSGSLAKQIAHGAPADIYISANPKWMAYLRDQQAIVPESETILATNSLIFMGRATSQLRSLSDLPQASRIALASPRSSPAGQYAAQAMTGAGVYSQLQQAAKLVISKDVRQALLYAERGEVDGAFVYGSDARLAQRSIILFTIAPESHEPILYPMALTSSGQQKEAAQAFYTFILSPAGQAILQQHGLGSP